MLYSSSIIILKFSHLKPFRYLHTIYGFNMSCFRVKEGHGHTSKTSWDFWLIYLNELFWLNFTFNGSKKRLLTNEQLNNRTCENEQTFLKGWANSKTRTAENLPHDIQSYWIWTSSWSLRYHKEKKRNFNLHKTYVILIVLVFQQISAL